LTLDAEGFLREFRSVLSSFSEVITAEFKITDISVQNSSSRAGPALGLIQTRVRYDLVGAGPDFFREERVGSCELVWESDPSGELRLRRWQGFEETRSRAPSPIFAEVSSQVFAGNASFPAQMLHGCDYWRTVLDGACGIDVYGHNGIALGDVDNDGFDDLYISQPAGLPNRLYRNRVDGTFEDITEESGTGILENTACALFLDVDNDGTQDLIVVRSSGPLLFHNQGRGKFREKPHAFRFSRPPQGAFTGAAAADYDRDGWVDIYFCLYLYYQGVDQYRSPLPYYDARNGPPNYLMRNNGDGTFTDVTAAAGLDQNNNRYSFCCGWSDYNEDGWPDLYVVNDFGRKNLYRNNADGTFTDVAAEAQVEDVGAGMSVCWLDYDKDGHQDLYVGDMWSSAGMRVTAQDAFLPGAPEEVRALYRKHARGNSLFRNGANGVFRDTSALAGVEMGRWAWSSDAWDFDHDGYPDLYIANGMVSGTSASDLSSFFWRQVVSKSPLQARTSREYEQGWNAINELIRSDGTWNGFERNAFYANNRDGTFSDVSGTVSMDFLEDGRAFALGDVDHDGRLEVFLKNRNGPQLRVLKNVMPDLGQAIAFRLTGRKSNRDGIGAAITVDTGKIRQTVFLQAGSGFLSQHSKEIFFGLGRVGGPVRASIRWPSGLVQDLKDLPPDHRIWVEEGSAPSRLEPFRQSSVSSRARTGAAEPHGAEALPSNVETWLLAPVEAPDFSLPDLTGRMWTLARFRGHPALLNFWVTESAPSQAELVRFNERHERWAAQGLQLIAVNLDSPGAVAAVRTYAREHKFSFLILLGSEDIVGIYNLLYRYMFDRRRDLAIPTSFLMDEDGAIVRVYQGPVEPEHVEHDFLHIPRTLSERLARSLPFPGVTDVTEVHRNYLTYGVAYFQRGYMAQAEASFQLAIRDDPQSAEATYGLGITYMKRQMLNEARGSFERVLKLAPSYPDTWPHAWNNLGVLAAQEGRAEEAIRYFGQALERNPDDVLALKNLGNAYRQQGHMKEAREILKRALEIDRDDAEANFGLAMVFAREDDTRQAYEYFQKALELRPDYAEALNNLGVLYVRTGRSNEAVSSFEHCMRAAPDYDQSYLNLAKLYVLEGEPEKARLVLDQLLSRHPGHAGAREMLAKLPH